MIEELLTAAMKAVAKKANPVMSAKQAIDVLNRRAVTMQKLFGQHSEIFEKWSTQLTQYDIFTDKNGFLKLRNTKANRAAYRQLIPWAKREQKLNVSVLQRKAAKMRQEWQQDIEDGYINEDEFINEQVYNAFLNDCADYFESCYNIAVLEGNYGKDAYDRADYLYNHRKYYIRAWNDLYKTGAFAEYENYYQEEQIFQEYTIDDESGEVVPRDDFYREV